jgi:predicted small secreted protein
MKHGARFALVVALALGAAFTTGCQNGVVGPSLTATIQTISLSPTFPFTPGDATGEQAARNICCCLVVGTVQNTSSVAAHIELRFPATSQGQNVGTAIDLEQNVPSQAVRAFTAVGIQAACNTLSLSQITADQRVRVIGLWAPPQ